MIDEFCYFLRVVFTPGCWIRNSFTNFKWDRLVREQLNNPSFSNLSHHTVFLNGVEIWVANYPYDCVSNYRGSHKAYRLPSRRTVFKFMDALEQAKIEGRIENG